MSISCWESRGSSGVGQELSFEMEFEGFLQLYLVSALEKKHLKLVDVDWLLVNVEHAAGDGHLFVLGLDVACDRVDPGNLAGISYVILFEGLEHLLGALIPVHPRHAAVSEDEAVVAHSCPGLEGGLALRALSLLRVNVLLQ